MENNALTLLKRYHYDKEETRDKDDEEYTWSASETVSAIDMYHYKNATYIISAYWHYYGSGDMADSDHNWQLSTTVYPLPVPNDVDSEEKAREFMKSTPGYKVDAGDNIPLHIREEETFTSGIRPHVIGAIDAYLADQMKKKAESSEAKLLPNAVLVHEGHAPEAETIYDFETEAGLGTAFYNCTQVHTVALGEDSQKALGIGRPLCYYYPDGRGKPVVCAYREEDHPILLLRRGNRWDTGKSAVLCALVDGKPAPLTPDEMRKILDLPSEEQDH